jgi:uncharacterized protein with PQ loop repeat
MIGTAAAVLAGLPQLRKLFLSKQADEFSMSTWLIWMFSQITALGYAISMRDVLYACVSGFWILFYGVMVTLIFKYRNSTPPVREAALPEEA